MKTGIQVGYAEAASRLHLGKPTKRHSLYRGYERFTEAFLDSQNDLIEGFTKKYGVHRLVYYEMHQNMNSAITREKQLKKWNRAWKLELIEGKNPEWNDLWDDIV